MKIQIASDLHLEFPENKKWIAENPLMPKGDVLLLAGDVVVDKYKKKARDFYNKIEADFPNIISTMGNHEFYHGTCTYAYPSYSSQITEHHIKLNNKSIVINGVKFVVSMLWSYVPPGEVLKIENIMNDYRIITIKDPLDDYKYPISTVTTNKYHKESLKFIQSEVEKKFAGPVVVMTHHIPSFQHINKKHKGSPINHGYASDLDDFIISHPNIVIWVCGHSHEFQDIMIGKTRVVRNALGYVEMKENIAFKRDFYVEV